MFKLLRLAISLQWYSWNKKRRGVPFMIPCRSMPLKLMPRYHTNVSVRFEPWNCWGLYWEVDVGPPRSHHYSWRCRRMVPEMVGVRSPSKHMLHLEFHSINLHSTIHLSITTACCSLANVTRGGCQLQNFTMHFLENHRPNTSGWQQIWCIHVFFSPWVAITESQRMVTKDNISFGVLMQTPLSHYYVMCP